MCGANSEAAAATLASLSSIFMCMFSADHSSQFVFSLFIPLQHTHILSLSLSLYLIPRPLSLSSDFPVAHWRVADQYIITVFEAYIYYRSDAITVVISLLPLA